MKLNYFISFKKTNENISICFFLYKYTYQFNGWIDGWMDSNYLMYYSQTRKLLQCLMLSYNCKMINDLMKNDPDFKYFSSYG